VTKSATHGELVPSHAGHLLAATLEGARVVLHSAPRWLALAMDWPADLPLQPSGDQWAPFPSMVRDLAENRLPVRDLVLELQTPSGPGVAVLVQGRFEEDLSAWVPGAPRAPGVLLMIRDVTDVVRERRRMAAIGTFHGLVGRSLPMLEVYQKIATYGPTQAPIIITGETGTGKELIAKAIHERSPRAAGPFVAVNCVALTAELFESELFGHEKGSFTDAHAMKKGKLELADGGTLFLDEIGEVSLNVQAKLLRVFETMSFTRLGGTKPIQVNVRLVVATNRDLREQSAAGTFRSDLYYRLNVFPISVPPLRERRDDVPVLTRYFIARFAEKYGVPIPFIEQGALDLLRGNDWPGNIRELRNICERLVIRSRGRDTITKVDVQSCGLAPATSSGEQNPLSIYTIPPAGIDLDELEKHLVTEALNMTEWNQTEAARLLGISVDRMNNRVKKWNLKHDSWRVNKS